MPYNFLEKNILTTVLKDDPEKSIFSKNQKCYCIHHIAGNI